MDNSNKNRITTLWISFITFTFIASLAFVVFFLFAPVKDSILDNSWDHLKIFIDSAKFFAPVVTIFMQALVILLLVLPSAPLQIIMGIMFGYVLGFGYAIAGTIIGNIIIFGLAKVLGDAILTKKGKKKVSKFSKKEEVSNKALYRLIVISYLIPVIPYGIIAYYLAQKGFGFIKYIIVTTVGTIPTTLLVLYIGQLIDARSTAVIAIVTAVSLGIIYLIYKGLSLLRRDTNFYHNNVRKMSYFIVFILKVMFHCYFKKKYNVTTNTKDFKKKKEPYVILFNHGSKFDFAFVSAYINTRKTNSMAAYYYFCNFTFGYLMYQAGIFPKYLQQPDVKAIKNALKVKKMGNNIAIAPEGRLSVCGCLESITESTGKLLKKLEYPLLAVRINGSYLSSPKWAKHDKYGRIDIHYEEVLTKEQIISMTDTEINEKIIKELSYDDFKWAEDNNVTFEGKDMAEGLENILFLDPITESKYNMMVKGDTITLNDSNTEIRLNNHYKFESNNDKVPINIKEWYFLQIEYMRKQVLDEHFEMRDKVTLKFPDPQGKWFSVVGSGECILNKNGLKYIGTVDDIEVEYMFELKNIKVLLFGAGVDFEIYHFNQLFYFEPTDLRTCVEWSIASEELYKRYILGE